MKITVAPVLGLMLSCGVASEALAQLPAGAKVQGIFTKDDQARKAREAQKAAMQAQQEALAQAQSNRQVEMWVPEPMPAPVAPAGYGYAQPVMYGYVMPVQATTPSEASEGEVQAAGHHRHAAPCYGPNGGAANGYMVAGNPHMMGGGTFPHGSAYDYGHPGRMFDGGRYGYFGGAHRTPGYPHHHFTREYVGPQGPPSAAVAYPYYTTRGPRDFLLDNPPSIGR